MAERTGNHQLDALIEAFEDQPTGSADGATNRIYRHGGSALLHCGEVSIRFARFLDGHGVTAYSSEDERADDLMDEMAERYTEDPEQDTYSPDSYGYSDRLERGGPAHSVTIVDTPLGTYMVDWTASQYGYQEFPMVQRRGPDGLWHRTWRQQS